MEDKKINNASKVGNYGKEGREKKSRKEQDVYSDINKVSDDITLKKEFELKLNSFNYFHRMKTIIFYAIPLVLSLIVGSIVFISNASLSDIYTLNNKDISYIYVFNNIYYYYIFFINFGWLSNFFNFNLLTLSHILSNFYNIDEQTTILFTYIAYAIFHMFFTFILFIVFSFVSLKIFPDVFSLQVGKEKEILKLDSLYQQNMFLGGKDEKEIIKNSENLKKKKKQLLDFVKNTHLKKYQLYESDYLSLYHTALKYQDSPFANQISDIINSNLKEIMNNKVEIDNIEECEKLYMSVFTESMKEVLFDYNFGIFNNKNINLKKNGKIIKKGIFKKNKNSFKNQWKIKLNNKHSIFKQLLILTFFKNLPHSIFFNFFEKNNIKFSEREKDFIINFRKITENDLKEEMFGKNKKIISLSYNLLFPNIKNYNKVINIYSKFINYHMKQYNIIRTINIATSETNQDEENQKAAIKLFNEIKNYKMKMYNYLFEIFTIIYKDLNIKILKNMEISLKDNIDMLYMIDKKMNFNELSLISTKIGVFELSYFYTLLNKTLKDMKNYKTIYPYYIETYMKSNVRDTFLFLKQFSNKY